MFKGAAELLNILNVVEVARVGQLGAGNVMSKVISDALWCAPLSWLGQMHDGKGKLLTIWLPPCNEVWLRYHLY